MFLRQHNTLHTCHHLSYGLVWTNNDVISIQKEHNLIEPEGTEPTNKRPPPTNHTEILKTVYK